MGVDFHGYRRDDVINVDMKYDSDIDRDSKVDDSSNTQQLNKNLSHCHPPQIVQIQKKYLAARQNL